MNWHRAMWAACAVVWGGVVVTQALVVAGYPITPFPHWFGLLAFVCCFLDCLCQAVKTKE